MKFNKIVKQGLSLVMAFAVISISTGGNVSVYAGTSVKANVEGNKGVEGIDDQGTSETPENPESTLKVTSDRAVYLYEGSKSKIKYEASETPVFSSSSEKIVKVDKNGNITAIGVGKATITVKVNELVEKVAVKVKSDTLSIQGKTKGTIYIPEGMKFSLKLKSKEYSKLTSSNKKYAKISRSGKDYYVKALKKGSTVISAPGASKLKLNVKVVDKLSITVSSSMYYKLKYSRAYTFTAIIDNKSKEKVKVVKIQAGKDASGKDFKNQPTLNYNKNLAPKAGVYISGNSYSSAVKRSRTVTQYVNVVVEYKGMKYKFAYSYNAKGCSYKLKKTIILN